ncbi:Alpha/Beta hydrolase protein [Pisolithus albus]|nr:Alpha/Beta hydrolase protein [Pisolithus albus]
MDGRRRTKEIVDPTYPLLEANCSVIESIRRETFTYGSSDVHKVCLVYPPFVEEKPLTGSDGLPPILVFFYGGGLVRGSCSSPPSYLVHNNLGAFFASRGILVVIPDYRLVPGITFPEGSEDVRDAIEWTIENVAEGDSNRFYAIAQHYYGSAKKVSANHPLSLLRRTDDSHIRSLPPVQNIMADSEPRVISTSMRTFAREFRKRGGTVDEFVLEGHDHLSPILALSSGSGEDWGYDVVRWIMG